MRTSGVSAFLTTSITSAGLSTLWLAMAGIGRDLRRTTCRSPPGEPPHTAFSEWLSQRLTADGCNIAIWKLLRRRLGFDVKQRVGFEKVYAFACCVLCLHRAIVLTNSSLQLIARPHEGPYLARDLQVQRWVGCAGVPSGKPATGLAAWNLKTPRRRSGAGIATRTGPLWLPTKCDSPGARAATATLQYLLSNSSDNRCGDLSECFVVRRSPHIAHS